ncbi:MAG: winged helix-turn-helix transcriptional regulator [Phycisphaerales bacterium]|nr:winged helix-turn-helix transcriptional regulator [Hyphomonadaceae bacterium]
MVTKARPRTEGAFGAIADPTRRAILDLVRHREMSAGDIARRFPVSRPAIAKHMRVLRQAGLLRERREATSRYYTLDPSALQAVDQWLAPYRLFWAARLVDLKRVVEEEAKAKPKKGE